MISLNKRCHLRRYLNHSESIINFSFQILLSLLVCLDCCNPDTSEAFSTTSDVSCINLAFISLAVDITANWLIAEQIDLFLLGITSRIVLELRPLSLGLQLNFWTWLHIRFWYLFLHFFNCDDTLLRLTRLFLLSMIFLRNCALFNSWIQLTISIFSSENVSILRWFWWRPISFVSWVLQRFNLELNYILLDFKQVFAGIVKLGNYTFTPY